MFQRREIAAAAVAVLSIIFLFASIATAATPVTTCGMVLENDGVLVGDLDCSALADSPALTIGNGHTLDLAGYTFTTNVTDHADAYPEGNIWCPTKCAIVGPGTLRTVSGEAVVFANRKLTLRDVTVVATGTNYSLFSWGRVSAIDSAIGGGHDGIIAGRTILEGTTINGVGGQAIVSYGGHVRIRSSDISGNGFDFPNYTVWAKAAKVESSTITGNAGTGIYAEKGLLVADSSITGNLAAGIYAEEHSLIVDSDVSGNCYWDGAETSCEDIVACERPRLDNTTCDVSVACHGDTWGICSLD